MNCPKCKQDSLAPFGRVEGVDIDFCSSCKGIWFDSGELAFYTETEEDLPDMETAMAAGRPTDLLCPRCEQALMEVRYLPEASLLVDVCPTCKGIFLDKGEVPRVERLAQRQGGLARVAATVKKLQDQGYLILGSQVR